MFRIIVKAALIVLVFVGSAQASVVYTLINQQYSGESTIRGATLSLTLTISDQAVQRGTFNVNEPASVPGSNFASGDLNDFIALSWAVGPKDNGTLTLTSNLSTNFVASLTFVDGIPAGMLNLHGETSEFRLSGASGMFSGTLASDFNNCNRSQINSVCSISGLLATSSIVPEPSTLAVLGFGLMSACATRRRAVKPRWG